MPNEIDYDDEEDNNLSLHEIYAQLLLEDDIIIVINKDDYDAIKAGLTSVKAKENTKLKNKDMPVDTNKLQFSILPCEDCALTEIRLQISLAKRKTFSIKRFEKVKDF